MAERKSISKKIRFEVFKRDSFVCQYCGKKAPDVVLEVDHLDPVSKGGGNELVNLITSCFDCNRGKSDRTLDDDSVVSKQHGQLKKIQERREQIELMFEWRKGLDNLDEDTAEMLFNYIISNTEGFHFSEAGERRIRRLIKKFPLEDILNAVDISAEQYLKYDDKGELIRDSVENYINKIGGILIIQKKPPIEPTFRT